MSGTFSKDFGVNVPGESGVSLTGSTIGTAYLIKKKVTVVTSSVTGGLLLLPSSYASGTHLLVKNRSSTTISVSPGSTNQIENYGLGRALDVASGGDAEFTSFDPPAAPAPRTWWL
jgi:hypothetical protein